MPNVKTPIMSFQHSPRNIYRNLMYLGLPDGYRLTRKADHIRLLQYMNNFRCANGWHRIYHT